MKKLFLGIMIAFFTQVSLISLYSNFSTKEFECRYTYFIKNLFDILQDNKGIIRVQLPVLDYKTIQRSSKESIEEVKGKLQKSLEKAFHLFYDTEDAIIMLYVKSKSDFNGARPLENWINSFGPKGITIEFTSSKYEDVICVFVLETLKKEKDLIDEKDAWSVSIDGEEYSDSHEDCGDYDFQEVEDSEISTSPKKRWGYKKLLAFPAVITFLGSLGGLGYYWGIDFSVLKDIDLLQLKNFWFEYKDYFLDSCQNIDWSKFVDYLKNVSSNVTLPNVTFG